MKETPVKSIKELLSVLGEHLDQLRPKNKPTPESVSAAKAAATVINSHNGTVKLALSAARMGGYVPEMSFLGIPVKPAPEKITEKSAV